MKTILCIRSSAIGDVIMTVPVLKQFTQTYPNVKVIMLTTGFLSPLFKDITNLSVHIIDLKNKHNGVKGVVTLYKELSKEYTFDTIIDLHDKLYSKLLLRLFKTENIPTFKIDKARKEKEKLTVINHKLFIPLKTTFQRYVDVFLEAGFNSLHFANKSSRNKLPIPLKINIDTSNTIIGLAPFAKHKGKILPLETVRQLIQLINKQHPNTTIFIFGGGRVEKLIANSLCAWFSNCQSVIGKLTLNEELSLMSNLNCVISMDSASQHMASLVGTPVISVWGQTHYYAGFFGFGQSYDDIIECDNLKCRPCSIFGNKPCYRKDYACLNNITATQIYSKTLKYILN